MKKLQIRSKKDDNTDKQVPVSADNGDCYIP